MAGFDRGGDAASGARERRLSERLLKDGVVTEKDLDGCRSEQERRRSEGRASGLADILVANGLLSSSDVSAILAEISEREPAPAALPPEAAARPDSDRFGKFIRVQLLGRGGMGEVWKSWDTGLGRWVALKFLRGGDRGDIARLLREAQTAGRLSHPNIAAIHEVGSDRGEHYIAMEYIEGQTLETYPRKDRKGLVRLIRDAARAVALAHREGVVHRDLKPSNLIVGERPGSPTHVYVADFGLARSMSDPGRLSQTGVLLGTPEYMSPEQARGETVDGRTDVWSLGATLYELTTDQVPFKGSNVVNILKRIMDEDPKAPRRIQPRINADLETIILKCLEKRPERRYPNADELAEDLDRYLNREPVHARPASVLYRLGKKLGRRKAAVAGVAVAAVLILALAGGWWFRDRPEREHLLNFQSGMVAWEELLRSSFGRVERDQLLARARETRAHFEKANSWKEKPEAHVMRARCFELERNEAGAMESLERAHALEPGHADARVELARALLSNYLALRGLPAIAHDLQGLRFPPLPSEGPREIALRERARSLLNVKGLVSRKQDLLEGLLAMGRSDYRSAATHLKRHTAKDGLDTQSLRLEGACLFYLKEYEAALEPLDRATQLDPDASTLNWMGMAYHASEKLPKAAAVFDRAIEIDPRHPLVRLNRGNLHLDLKKFEEARQDFEKAIEIAPRLASAWCNLGTAVQELNRLDEAIRNFTNSIEINPSFGLAYFNRGNARRLKKEHPLAVADYDKAIALDSTHAMAWSHRGLARSEMGAYREALVDFTRAIELDPELASAWVNRGNASQELGDYKAAIADFTKAAELDPGLAVAFMNRGNARRLSGDLPNALADYDRAIQLDGGLTLAFTNRGLTRYLMGDFRASLRDLDRALELQPGEPRACLNRGNTRQELGDLSGAIADFTKAIEGDPASALAYSNRGNARRLGNDIDGAMRDYTRATELDPKLAVAWVNTGLVRYLRGDFAGCIRDQERAIALDPSKPEPHINRGNARQMLGDLDGAIRDFTRVLEIAPRSAMAYYNRGNARRLSGDLKGAAEDYTKALEIDPSAALARLNRGLARAGLRQYAEAIEDFRKVAESNPGRWEPHYNIGCAEALRGKSEEALDALEKAESLGFRDAAHLSKDEDLESVRNEKRFRALLERLGGR